MAVIRRADAVARGRELHCFPALLPKGGCRASLPRHLVVSPNGADRLELMRVITWEDLICQFCFSTVGQCRLQCVGKMGQLPISIALYRWPCVESASARAHLSMNETEIG